MSSESYTGCYEHFDSDVLSLIHEFWDQIPIDQPFSYFAWDYEDRNSIYTPPLSEGSCATSEWSAYQHPTVVKWQPISPNPSESSIDCINYPSAHIPEMTFPVDVTDLPTDLLDDIDQLPNFDENELFQALNSLEIEEMQKVHKKPDIQKPKKPKQIVKKPPKTPKPPKITKKFICTCCHKVYKDRCGLKRHFKSKSHQQKVTEEHILDPADEDPKTWLIKNNIDESYAIKLKPKAWQSPMNCKTYGCYACPAFFEYQQELFMHLQAHYK